MRFRWLRLGLTLTALVAAACGGSSKDPSAPADAAAVDELDASDGPDASDAPDAISDASSTPVDVKPLVEVSHCRGQRTQCAAFAEQAACQAQGCTYGTGKCSGTPSNCWDGTGAGTNLRLCRELAPYCRVVWTSIVGDVCQAATSADTSVPCNAFRNRLDCPRSGCAWSETPGCTGAVLTPCEQLSGSACGAAAGCQVVTQREAPCSTLLACVCPDGGGSACGSLCVDLDSSPLNCGQCGRACALSESCVDGVCTDTNECAANTSLCAAPKRCENRAPGYSCECAPGYEGPNCTNINECARADACDPNATCNDTDGSYTCTCKAGFVGDGKLCSDVDECATSTTCAPPSVCSNRPGSYVCASPQPTCQDGSCSCPSPLSACDASCVSLQSDAQHCGRCDRACPSTGATCNQGECVCSQAGLSVCGDACVDLNKNRQHCTACYNRCAQCDGACNDVKQLFGGYETSCALMNNGQLYCWGYNSQSGTTGVPKAIELSPGVPLTDVANVHIGEARVFAILTNGDVYQWGRALSSAPEGGLHLEITTPERLLQANGQPLIHVVEIDSYQDSLCARTSEGFAYAWGVANATSYLGNGTANSSTRPVQVLTSAVDALSQLTSVVGHGDERCALTSAKQVYCWGRTQFATQVQVSGGGALSDVVSLQSSAFHTCALRTNGEIFCWGDGTWGGWGAGTTSSTYRAEASLVSIAAGTPLPAASKLVIGSRQSCAVVTGGAVYCWGRGALGALGSGSSPSVSAPLQVLNALGPVTGIVDLLVGDDSSCALDTAGTIQCWGDNSGGQLGDGTTTDANRAVTASLPTGAPRVTSLAGSRRHRCANHDGKNVSCWGGGNYGKNGSATAATLTLPTFVRW